jgi:hypothetical protein
MEEELEQRVNDIEILLAYYFKENKHEAESMVVKSTIKRLQDRVIKK